MNGGSVYRLFSERRLKTFVRVCLERLDIRPEYAAEVADVLVEADARGVESHGVARLNSYYVSRIRAGTMNPHPLYTVVNETRTAALVDADNGLGHPAGILAMRRAIAKAKESGVGMASVRNSNHYGIAAYYAMMALEHDMIGVSTTNSVRYAVPTFGSALMLGTNPLAFAVPAAEEPPFVLDFATTTVPRGRLEVFRRKGLPLKDGWAVDSSGVPTSDPLAALNGALLPLGGFGTDSGGHKGYGLGLLVDILCGVLSGSPFGNDLGLPDADDKRGAVSHWFLALRVDAFRDIDEFKRDMDRELRSFKTSARAPGEERVYVAGEIEHERALRNRQNGIPVHESVVLDLDQLARELGVEPAITS
ncbi:MAG: Ldh family oxidoreductase [Vulcanimicrobiaceae bacterium]